MGKGSRKEKGSGGGLVLPLILGLLLGAGLFWGLSALTSVLTPLNDGRAYTIYTDGVTITARPGHPNLPAYAGTNASDIIQKAITAANGTGGGDIKVQSGTYVIDYPITLADDIHLSGEGNSTIFIPDGAIEGIFLSDEDGNTGVELYDFTIRADDLEEGSLDYGILVESTVYCIVDGIYVIGNDTVETINVSIQVMGVGVSVRDCGIINPGHTGILVGLGSGVEVSRCAIDGCDGFEANGILMIMTVGSFIRDNYVIQMEQAGISLVWCYLDQVLNNYVHNCGSPDANDTGNFDFSGLTDCTIVGNVASESEWDGANCVDVANSTFSANIWNENGMDGLWFDADCEGNVVQGDQAFGNTNGYDFRSVGESNLFIGCACDTITVDTHDQIAYCLVEGVIVTNP